MAIAEINSLRKRSSEREEEFRQEKRILLESHESAMRLIKDKHESELSGRQSLMDELAKKELQFNRDLRSQRDTLENKIEELIRSHKKQMEEINGQQFEEAERLKASISGLESQLQSLSDQAETEKASLSSENNKLDAKAKSLQVILIIVKLDALRVYICCMIHVFRKSWI